MRFKFFAAAMLAAILLLTLTACGKTKSTATPAKLNSDVQQSEQQNHSKPSTNGDKASKDEAWKEKFEKQLFEEYEVIPEYYEDLGDGIYQVYVKIGDEVVPFVTVDSATGDYHG